MHINNNHTLQQADALKSTKLIKKGSIGDYANEKQSPHFLLETYVLRWGSKFNVSILIILTK